MNQADFADKLLDEGHFDTYFDEAYWQDNFSSDACLEEMETEAKKRGVALIESDSWDYDRIFYDAYQSAEKGLS